MGPVPEYIITFFSAGKGQAEAYHTQPLEYVCEAEDSERGKRRERV
jgi:hypothetical protein